MEEAFQKYVSLNYDLANPDIKRKYEHSLKVANLAKQIATSLNLSEEEIHLAYIAGYLHDIGRFEEVKRFNKLSINNHFDHADYALKILYEDSYFKKFNILEKDWSTISFAIRNHNKYIIEETSSKIKLLMAKILRDADKIDIYRVIKNRIEVDGDVSSKVLKCLEEEKSVPHNLVKNKTDLHFFRLAWIYDFNFKVSLDILKKLDYLNMYLNEIKKEKIKDALIKERDKAFKRMEEKLC